MKIFGYEIKKVRRVKRVVIIASAVDDTPANYRIEGDGWGFSESEFFAQRLKEWLFELNANPELPKLKASQVVVILKIFAAPLYEFVLESWKQNAPNQTFVQPGDAEQE
jgi:hypothetical protein